MTHDIAGWTVWITGAGTGIGAATARAFAAAGCHVALSGRRAAPLQALAEEIGAAASVHPADVTDRDALARIAQALAERTGRLDVLCNNAGLNIARRRFAELDADSFADWDAVIEVNIRGALNAIAAVLPVMRARGGGLILNTSSWAGRFHSAVGGAMYGASKHALSSLSASLNADEGAHGIRSTALCPAEVATPLLARRPGYDTADDPKAIQPEDMAEAALFCARMNPDVAVHEIVLAPVRR